MLLPGARSATTPTSTRRIHHATNVGTLFRPDNPLLPNYKHVPIALPRPRVVARGRAAPPSARPAGRPSRRRGGADVRPDRASSTTSSRSGSSSGRGNALGEPIPIGEAERAHRRARASLNDWSARDIQKWEYQPLGPFLAKNFATIDLARGW